MRIEYDNAVYYIDESLTSREDFIEKYNKIEPVGYLLHRENGPAFIASDKNPIVTEMWIYHGKMHRKDGPAIILRNGLYQWYFNGIQYYSFWSYLDSGYITDEDKIALKLEYS